MTRIALDHADLARRYGIHFMAGLAQEARGMQLIDRSVALDAQPALITAANAGIPSLFTTYVDPTNIMTLVAPVKAVEMYGETKKGTWVSDTAMFIVAERTGEVSSYGDFSQDGMANANVNFPQRQSYHYQTNTRWGERELARMSEAKVDWASKVNEGSILALLKYQNLTYLYGITGLQLYGGTNDPSLLPSLTPTATWFGGDPLTVVYADIQRLVQQLIIQGEGLVDTSTVMTLGLSPGNAVNLTNANTYNVNVMTYIKTNFPNLKIVTIPEFAINGGGNAGGTEFVQLIADTVEGQRTVECAFTEKMRAHAIVTKTSSWEQKKSQGTWGTIYYRPVFVTSMLGV
jgi:hypothetical protein